MGIAHPDMDLPELLNQRLRGNSARQTITNDQQMIVQSDLESIDTLRRRYSQLISEISDIYTENGIQENQIELINIKFGVAEQYENYKRKEIHISVLSEQSGDDAIVQRLITELREAIDLLIILKTDLIYNFDRFRRARNAQTWFNEMASQSTRRAREITTNTPAIKWQGSSYSTCVVRREHI